MTSTAATAGSAPDSLRQMGHTVPWRIEPLWQDPRPTGSVRTRGGELPADLAARHSAALAIPLHRDRPTIVANFVSTLDGVVAFDSSLTGGGRAVSGDFEPDRFMMGLLRSLADAVLVGAGTARASQTRAWTPGRVHPPSADAFARWRQALGLAPAPTTVIVSGSGVLHEGRPWRPAPDQPMVVLTTETGAARLRADGPSGIAIVTSGHDGRVPVAALLELLASRGFGVVVSEAGPTTFGELIEAGAVDELFLTLAPRIAGRSGEAPRPGLAQGVTFEAPLAPTGRLRAIMRTGDHLFLRYALETKDRDAGGLS